MENRFFIAIEDFNTNNVFYQKLVDAGMSQSTSRLDNALMEDWGILKSEMYNLKKFTNREELVSTIETTLAATKSV